MLCPALAAATYPGRQGDAADQGVICLWSAASASSAQRRLQRSHFLFRFIHDLLQGGGIEQTVQHGGIDRTATKLRIAPAGGAVGDLVGNVKQIGKGLD